MAQQLEHGQSVEVILAGMKLQSATDRDGVIKTSRTLVFKDEDDDLHEITLMDQGTNPIAGKEFWVRNLARQLGENFETASKKRDKALFGASTASEAKKKAGNGDDMKELDQWLIDHSKRIVDFRNSKQDPDIRDNDITPHEFKLWRNIKTLPNGRTVYDYQPYEPQDQSNSNDKAENKAFKA